MYSFTLCRPAQQECPQKGECYRFTAPVTKGTVYSQADLSRSLSQNGVCSMFMPDTSAIIPPDPSPASQRRDLLIEALEAVDGPRAAAYGKPEDSFKAIAALWNAYLEIAPAPRLAPHDVAIMLALLKVARLAGSRGTHTDSWVDLAGYAACGYECSQGGRS